MNWNKIKLIIAREFLVRVRKTSFLVATLLTPLLMAAMIVVPALLMTVKDGSGQKQIMVLDSTGLAKECLVDNEEIKYLYSEDMDLEKYKASFEDSGLYAVCVISKENENYSIKMFSKRQVAMGISSQVEHAIQGHLEQVRLSQMGIDDIEGLLSQIKQSVQLKTMLWRESGGEKESMSVVYMGISYGLSFLIYMFIFMYGSMIIRSVVEEKQSRIMEVIISAVKPLDLMMGKIFGVALVALLQFTVWLVLGGIFAAIGIAAVGNKLVTAASTVPGVDISSMTQAVATPTQGTEMLASLLSTFQSINVPFILFSFFLFFILGYLLYASMFAAIGSVSDAETESQQFQLPVTIPLILGLFIMFHTFQYPDDALSFWGSIIPFTSPMVMLARVPFGVPMWQWLLSVVLLLITFLAMAYCSSRIYRVGILMYGKKVTWKELAKWIKYKI